MEDVNGKGEKKTTSSERHGSAQVSDWSCSQSDGITMVAFNCHQYFQAYMSLQNKHIFTNWYKSRLIHHVSIGHDFTQCQITRPRAVVDVHTQVAASQDRIAIQDYLYLTCLAHADWGSTDGILKNVRAYTHPHHSICKSLTYKEKQIRSKSWLSYKAHQNYKPAASPVYSVQ